MNTIKIFKIILRSIIVPVMLFAISLMSCSSSDTGGMSDDTSDYSTATCDELNEYLSDAVLEMRACSSDSDCAELGIPTYGSCGCTHNLVVNVSANTTEYEEIVEALENQEDCSLSGTCDCPEADGYVCQDSLCGWNYI